MLIPYDVDRPRKSPPLAVVALVLVEFVAFGVVALDQVLRGPDLFVTLSIVPEHVRWYAFVTYMLLHETVLHLSVNMLFLWVFGPAVEDVLGWRRFVGLYVVAGALTGMLQCGMSLIAPGVDRSVPIVGASGAVATIIGVFAARFYRSGIKFVGLPWRVPAVVLIAAALATEMTAVLVELVRTGTLASFGTAHWVHIGGFLLGMGFAQVARMPSAGRREYLAADASAYLDHGSPLAAARRLEAAMRRDPENAALEAELGRAWAAGGDREQSLAHYRHAIAALLQRGNKRDAATAYGAYARDHEGSLEAPAQFAVASALEEQGDAEGARGAFERLLAAWPDAGEAEMARLRLATLLLRRLSQPEAAHAVLRDFRDRYPQSEFLGHAEALIEESRRG